MAEFLEEPNCEKDWENFLQHLVSAKFTSYEEISKIILGALTPNQIGTQLASDKNFQKKYPKGKSWQAAKAWFYSQPLGCRHCKSLLQLEVEHLKSKVLFGEEAHDLEYMILLCKRCNAKQRPSHKNAGKTKLSTGAALSYILLLKNPKTFDEYSKLCREYGLTVSDIRFQEAWALAIWLAREGRYIMLDAIPKVKTTNFVVEEKSIDGLLFK